MSVLPPPPHDGLQLGHQQQQQEQQRQGSQHHVFTPSYDDRTPSSTSTSTSASTTASASGSPTTITSSPTIGSSYTDSPLTSASLPSPPPSLLTTAAVRVGVSNGAGDELVILDGGSIGQEAVSNSEDATTPPPPAKPNNGRRGIKKSRAGCFTCKRVKLKCKENRPTCDYCAHRGLQCEWPSFVAPWTQYTSTLKGKTQRAKKEKSSSSPSTAVRRDLVLEKPPASLLSHDAPPLFTTSDIKLFKHFVEKAYPNHPFGNESVWTHEVPILSHKYDYLINSMLALAASELSLADLHKSPSNSLSLHYTSLNYRSRAVTSLSRAIQRGIPSSAEGNAMLATILSLLFQSTFIADGLIDYMSFIRGAIVVSKQMGMQGLAVLFKTEEPPLPERKGVGEFNEAALLQEEVVRGCVESLELCQELCHSELEKNVWGILMDSAASLEISSAYGYIQLRRMYGLFAHQMTVADFVNFTSPESPSAHTFRILQAHFVALQLIMNPIASTPTTGKSACPVKDTGRSATVGWLTNLNAELTIMESQKRAAGVERYSVWSRWIEREILGGRLLDGSRTLGGCVVQQRKKVPVSVKMESSGIARCPYQRPVATV